MSRGVRVIAPEHNLGWILVILLIAAGCRPTPPSPLPPGVAVHPWGYTKATLQADGQLTPRWLGALDRIGLCLDAPLDLDTSQWRVQIHFPSSPQSEQPPFTEPTAEAGSKRCFKRTVPAALPSSRHLEVCAVVHDGFDEKRYAMPCFSVAYEADSSRYEELYSRIGMLMSGRGQLTSETLLHRADRLAAEAEMAGFPLLTLYPRLLAIRRLRRDGGADGLTKARHRLRALPHWLDQPTAAPADIPVRLERAKVARASGRLREAWRQLEQADAAARQYPSARGIAVAVDQASILVGLGQRDEPRRRLTAALDGCATGPCHPLQLADAHSLRAWLILIDPDATPPALALAKDSLARALETAPQDQDTAEQANLLVNRAFLTSRTGGDPSAALDQARSLLRPLPPTPRRASLLAWANVVAGLDAIARDRPQRALESCVPLANEKALPRAASWVWSCRGHAYRALGHLASAGNAFEHAIRFGVAAQASPSGHNLGQDLRLAPGRLAADFFHAARVTIDRGDPQAAWEILAALDDLAAQTACAAGNDRPPPERQGQRARLQEQLDATEPPMAPRRARQLAPLRDQLRTALEETLRTASAHCTALPTGPGLDADLRAFALDDEVVLLARNARGAVTVARRTPLGRREIKEILNRLEAMQDHPARHNTGRDTSWRNTSWRNTAAPLAQALIPPTDMPLSPVTRYALHGLLQRVPLAALPLEGATDPVEGEAWLISRTVPVWRPSFVESRPDVDINDVQTTRRPVFVVDPRSDLPTAAAGRERYRQRFPTALILEGVAATGDALRASFAGASFLHIDAHGQHDVAFPELSGLRMSDRLVTIADLARDHLPRDLVNLSSCHVGHGVPSSDSGRYGFAGALVRRGVPWVVASSAALDDRLAFTFNDAFYEAIVQGRDIPHAFAHALHKVRSLYPVADWARLRLIGSRAGGKTNASPTTTE